MNVHSVVAALSRTRTDQTRTGDAGIEYGSVGDVRGADEISRSPGSSPNTTTLHTTTMPKRSARRAARVRDDNCNRFDAFISRVQCAMDAPGKRRAKTTIFVRNAGQKCQNVALMSDKKPPFDGRPGPDANGSGPSASASGSCRGRKSQCSGAPAAPTRQPARDQAGRALSTTAKTPR